MEVNENIANYIRLMKLRLSWYGDYEWMGTSFFGWSLRLYLKIRGFLIGLVWFTICVSLYFVDNFGLYDGTFVYAPLTLLMATLCISLTYNGDRQHILTWSLNSCFLTHNDRWMDDIRDSTIKPLRKLLVFYINYNTIVVIVYTATPFLLDVIFHYVFDMYPEHVTFPMPLSPLLRNNAAWDTSYYTVTVLNVWIIFELVCILQGFLVNYSLLTIFFFTEQRIFKEKIKSLDLVLIDERLEEIISWHRNLIRLNLDLKAIFGLPCAFQDVFTSLTITLVLFTVMTYRLQKTHPAPPASLNDGGPLRINLRYTNDLARFSNGILDAYNDCRHPRLYLKLVLVLVLIILFVLQNQNVVVLLAYGSALVFYLMSALVYCSLGQLLESESEDIYWTLYDIPWYTYSPEVRKDLTMLIRQARSPLIIDYRRRSTMNLVTFMQIIRTAYSYFTLLQSMTS